MNNNFDSIIALALRFIEQGNVDAAVVTLVSIQLMREKPLLTTNKIRPS